MRLWDVKAGSQVTALNGHSGCVLCVAWSPDGSRAASCGEDCSVRIWDPRHGRILFVLHEHSGSVVCMAFSPHGSLLATGSGRETKNTGYVND